MDLYWFMPAFANSSVGSESGTTDDDGTMDQTSAVALHHGAIMMLTESVTILFKVLQECVSYSDSIPLMRLLGDRCHIRKRPSPVLRLPDIPLRVFGLKSCVASAEPSRRFESAGFTAEVAEGI